MPRKRGATTRARRRYDAHTDRWVGRHISVPAAAMVEALWNPEGKSLTLLPTTEEILPVVANIDGRHKRVELNC